jgi:hypothetical protein
MVPMGEEANVSLTHQPTVLLREKLLGLFQES